MTDKKFVCEQCGGELEIIADGIGRCTYNPSHIQKIPKRNQMLFQKAQKLRLEEKDFDGALEIYERIIFENPKESAAHWGIVLCKYGIEYVKDYNGNYLPTCHRIIQESILDDGEFQLALKYASSKEELKKYQNQGKLIDQYQKKIKQIAANEAPYDVFISFKATDDHGFPTNDSITADRLYNYLSKELRMKVFFSPISLEGKTGEFEPYIYAALKSAKVMVLVASSVESVCAVWVKNEWTRFIQMAKEDAEQKKTITLAMIGDLKKEQLPKKLQIYQGNKIDEDVIFEKFCHYIDDYIGETKLQTQRRKSSVQISEFQKILKQNIEEKQKIAEWYLQNGEFGKAEVEYSAIIKKHASFSKAYWGRLMCKFQVKNQEEFAQKPIPNLEENQDYMMAVQFSNMKERIEYQRIARACKRADGFSKELQSLQEEYDEKYQSLHDAGIYLRDECDEISDQTRIQIQKVQQLKDEMYEIEEQRKMQKEKPAAIYFVFGIIFLSFLGISYNLDHLGDYGIFFFLWLGSAAGIVISMIYGVIKKGKKTIIMFIGMGVLLFVIHSLIVSILFGGNAADGKKNIIYIGMILIFAGCFVKRRQTIVALKEKLDFIETEKETAKALVDQCIMKDLAELNKRTNEKEIYGEFIKTHDAFESEV